MISSGLFLTSNKLSLALKCLLLSLIDFRRQLVSMYGETSIILSSANTHSYEKRKISFQEYADRCSRIEFLFFTFSSVRSGMLGHRS